MKDWKSLEPDEYKLINVHYSAGRSGHSIKKVVLHHNAGNLTVQGCYNVWQTRAASAHYQVQSDGWIGQLVDDRNTAWHSGNWTVNCESIGIEHADISSSPWLISDACLENGAHLTAAVCLCYGLGRPEWRVNVFPHSDFSSTSCPASIAGSQWQAYMNRAQEWYDAMQNGTEASSTQGTSQPTETAGASKGDGPSYALRVRQTGAWLDTVTGWDNDGSEGFAGYPYYSHDFLAIFGGVAYQVHTMEDGWLPAIDKGDESDTVYGCAGIAGHRIDAVRILTPGYRYRSQTTERAGWLDGVDSGSNTEGYASYAGMIGEPLDRLQIAKADGCPW